MNNSTDKNNIVSITDKDGILTYVNDAYCSISKYDRTDLIGNNHSLVRSADTPSFIYKEMWKSLKAEKEWNGLIKNRDKFGKPFIINTKIIPLYKNKKLIGYKSCSNEVTDFVNAFNSIKSASKNPITDLNNRDIMLHDIDYRSKDFFQIALLDIDNFKYINDYYGYKVGDELIKKVADIISDSINKFNNLKIYHISIDEFAIIHILDEEQAFDTDLCDVSKNIIANIEMDQMVVFNNIKLNISLSIGMSYGNDTYETIKQADMALSYSKDNNIPMTMFNKIVELREKLSKVVYWSSELKMALSNNKIIPWLQPIIDNKTGAIVKFEALMRLINSENIIISPLEFIEISKKNKIYDRLSEMMIKKTFDYFVTNHDHFNINLTWEDLKDDNIKNIILLYLDNNAELGERLTIEIVESESIENYTRFIDFINIVKTRNVSIALDDFGSGYSNFIYLEKLNIDCIKIDGSLIQGMMTNENTLFIVQSIVKIAKKLKLETVAEFVSSEEIFKKVKKLGIDYSQGYYFGKPRPTSW